MDTTQQEEPTSALQRKAARIHQNPDLAMPMSKKQKGQPGKNRGSKPSKQRSNGSHSQPSEDAGVGEGEETDRTEVEKKIVALQRIVPGGEELGVDKLFEETAEYILSLQCQVKAMRALTNFFEGLERNKRKLGG